MELQETEDGDNLVPIGRNEQNKLFLIIIEQCSVLDSIESYQEDPLSPRSLFTFISSSFFGGNIGKHLLK